MLKTRRIKKNIGYLYFFKRNVEINGTKINKIGNKPMYPVFSQKIDPSKLLNKGYVPLSGFPNTKGSINPRRCIGGNEKYVAVSMDSPCERTEFCRYSAEGINCAELISSPRVIAIEKKIRGNLSDEICLVLKKFDIERYVINKVLPNRDMNAG
jgi:hypothetical protein